MTSAGVPRIHAVTDDRVLARGREFAEAARAVLRVGGPSVALHLRGAGTEVRRLLELVRDLLPAARRTGSLLVVNDRVDVALAAGADAVHLGRRSLPPAAVRRIVDREVLVGASVHSVSEAREAGSGGADYLFVGTIYHSASHPAVEASGPGLVTEVSRTVDVPLVAIGGLEPGRVGEVAAAGAWGLAAVSGVWEAEDPGGAVTAFLQALRRSSAST